MNLRASLIGLSLTAWLLGPVPAAAQPETGPPSPPLTNVRCGDGADGDARTYLSIDNAFGDTRADGNGRIRLRGWIHIPNGGPPSGGFPVIIFNHGSNKEQTSDNRCVLADYFSTDKRGYILFVPIRRGHDGSTGEYFEDYAERKLDELCASVECTDMDERWWRRYFTMNYLKEQQEDVVAAIRYVQANVRKANREKIAVMGQSFGGMVTLLFNELPNFNEDGVAGNGLDVRAAVAISAGAQSWGENTPEDYLEERLRVAVRQAKRPIYFLQPKNDKSILPTIELSYEAGYAGLRYQATMFGAVPDSLIQPCLADSEAEPGESTCGDAAHGKFVREISQVRIWGPAVVEFLRRMGVD